MFNHESFTHLCHAEKNFGGVNSLIRHSAYTSFCEEHPQVCEEFEQLLKNRGIEVDKELATNFFRMTFYAATNKRLLDLSGENSKISSVRSITTQTLLHEGEKILRGLDSYFSQVNNGKNPSDVLRQYLAKGYLRKHVEHTPQGDEITFDLDHQ